MLKKSFLEEWQQFKTDRVKRMALLWIPVFACILMGIAFSGQTIKHIPMAIVNQDQSDFSHTLEDAFSQSDTFKIVAYLSSEAEIEEAMQKGQIRAALVIPKDFYNAIVTLKSPNIMMIYDGSNMSITSQAKTQAMTILLTYKTGAMMSQLENRLGLSPEEAKNMAMAFQFKDHMLYNSEKSFEAFLTPIFLAGIIQAAITLTASLSVSHSIYALKPNQRRGYTSGKVAFYGVAGTLSMMIGVGLQTFIYHVPFRGHYMSVFVLTLPFALAVAAFNVIISAIIGNRMVAMIGGGIIFIPNSVMAGTTWPLYAMPLGYQAFAKYPPFMHFVLPLRNIYLKGTGLATLLPDIRYLIGFALVCVLIGEGIMAIAGQEEGAVNEL